MAVAVIIAPRPDLRLLLERQLHELPRFGGAVSFPTVEQARDALQRSNTNVDFAFLSEDLGTDSISDFIQASRISRYAKRTTFIAVLKFASSDEERLAEFLAAGAHGILREPVTQKSLEDVIEISRSVRSQGTKVRLKTAAALFVASAVDKLTREQGIPTEKKDLMTKVRDACRDYKRLTGVSLTMDAVAPDPKKPREYTGVSRRVREIYELRLKSLIGKLFQVQERTPSGKLKTVK